MFWVNVQRVFKSGFINFWRNGFVSLSAILVMTLTLFVIGCLIFVGAILQSSLAQIKEKVDINVYFVTSANEEDILSLKKSLEVLPEVASVEYTSREAALAAFKERNQNDQLTLQALEELGDNPLGALLNIRAKDPSQYEGIANFLQSKSSASSGNLIDKINYFQNKVAIDTLTKIITSSRTLGLAIAIIMSLISVMIIFNTIRLAIYSSREEISVMRLVGANNQYIRGPFIVEGAMYGLLSAIVVIILFLPLTYWLGPSTSNFFGGINLFTYYLHSILEVAAIMIATGVILGVLSSYLAVRRYLDL